MKNFKKAYTLIEMLMVVAIIGVLASSIIIGLGASRASARDARRITDLKNVQVVLELYYNKYGFYPRQGELATGSMSWSDFNTIMTSKEVDLKINKLPRDPSSSSGKSYMYGTNGQSYVLGAQLETDHPSLNESLKENTFGVPCSDKNVYCTTM